MHCKIITILLALTSYGFTQQQSGICKSDFQGIPLSCCLNYQLVENECIDNCTRECPPPFYGRFCKEKCSCCNQCDKIKGCINATGECDSEDGTEFVQFHWPSIFISLTGSFAVCFTCCIIIIFISRRRKPVTRECVVSTVQEKDLTASKNVYDYLGKESYNVLKLKTADTE